MQGGQGGLSAELQEVALGPITAFQPGGESRNL